MPLLNSAPLIEAEEILVQRLMAREEAALRTLYEQYSRNLLAVLRRVVGDEPLAQDLLQEALLKVWLGIASYDATRGRLFTWMVRVCCNYAVDALRSPRHQFHHRTKSLETAAVYQTPAPTPLNPDHIDLREFVPQLKPRQRELIDLLYFGGCTQAETADQLGIPLATVKTRARAALTALSGLVR